MSSSHKTHLKTGIMGGSFNPCHLAHLNSVLTVKKQFHLDNILLIPTYKTPLKKQKKLLSVSHRLKILDLSIKKYPFIQIDDQEIQRQGISYSYQTINQLLKTQYRDLFFIIGLDSFYSFDQWKNFKNILQKTRLIVTSRLKYHFPKSISQCPKCLQNLIYKINDKQIILQKNQGYSINFCYLKDMCISASQIRQRIQKNLSLDHLLSKNVQTYIKKTRCYLD